MKIIKLEAENVKRLRAINIQPDGAPVVIIGGRNQQGKSSTLDSIEMALAGGKSIPDVPLREGARKGRSYVDLGEIRVERKFTSKGSTLVVTNAEGVPQASPQGILDALCAKVAFDPMEFARGDEKKQDVILKKALGIDWSKLDGQDAAHREERKELNRDVKRLEAQLDGIPEPKGAPKEPVSSKELLAKLEEIAATQAANAEKRENTIKAHSDLATINTRISEINGEVGELKLKIESLIDQADRYSHVAADRKRIADNLKTESDALVDPDPTPVKAELAGAEEANRLYNQAQERKGLAKELSEKEAAAEALTDKIEAIKAGKAAQLEAAKFPVEGLGFDESGPTLNGMPLSQCCQSERLRVSIAIGLALNPRLKVLLIREGAFLDEDALKLVGEMAAEAGAQVWIERVGKGDAGAIIIEDGEIEAVAGAAE